MGRETCSVCDSASAHGIERRTGNRRNAIQLAGTEWDAGAVKADVWFSFRRRAGVVPKRSRKASTKWDGLRKPTVAAITVIGRVPYRRISRAVFRRIDRMNSCVDCPVSARNRRFKCILLMARQDAAAVDAAGTALGETLADRKITGIQQSVTIVVFPQANIVRPG